MRGRFDEENAKHANDAALVIGWVVTAVALILVIIVVGTMLGLWLKLFWWGWVLEGAFLPLSTL